MQHCASLARGAASAGCLVQTPKVRYKSRPSIQLGVQGHSCAPVATQRTMPRGLLQAGCSSRRAAPTRPRAALSDVPLKVIDGKTYISLSGAQKFFDKGLKEGTIDRLELMGQQLEREPCSKERAGRASRTAGARRGRSRCGSRLASMPPPCWVQWPPRTERSWPRSWRLQRWQPLVGRQHSECWLLACCQA